MKWSSGTLSMQLQASCKGDPFFIFCGIKGTGLFIEKVGASLLVVVVMHICTILSLSYCRYLLKITCLGNRISRNKNILHRICNQQSSLRA